MKLHLLVFVGSVLILYFLPSIIPTTKPNVLSSIAIALLSIVWYVTAVFK